MKRYALLALGAITVIGAGYVAAAPDSRSKDEARAVEVGVPYTEFNWKTLSAHKRGCNACHGDQLAATVSRLVVGRAWPKRHGIFATSYGIPMRVEDCLICHGKSFAGTIHSRHMHDAGFTAMGGNCDSCHTMIKGRFVLYTDETRYEIINGIRYDPTPPFSPPAAK
jgi:hypothetical protein